MKKNKILVLKKRKHIQDTVKNAIPSEVASVQPKESNDKVSNAAGKGKRVLIVEDDDFLRGLLTHSLNDVGCKVDSARSAETGFEFLSRHSPDIILLDLLLPGMNGFDFLSEIKKKQKLVVPVVVLSNLGSKEDIEMALSLGAVDFMVKANVTPAQIVQKVQNTLSDGI
jgi:DNA-binding response OmpR family regulator